MSTPSREQAIAEYKEEVIKRYNDMVAEGDWNGIQGLGFELQDAGYPQWEIELSNTLTAEELKDWKAWNKLQEEYDRDVDNKQ